MGMDSTFSCSKEIAWKTSEEKEAGLREHIASIISTQLADRQSDIFFEDKFVQNLTDSLCTELYWEDMQCQTEYLESFEGGKCDTIFKAITEFLGEDIWFEHINLSVECLEYVIQYVSNTTPRLGNFASKEHMLRVLNELLDLVRSGGSVTFYAG